MDAGAQADEASQVDTFAIDQLVAQETAGPIGPSADAFANITTTVTGCGHNTGKVTVAPKTPVGEYKIKVRVDAPATGDYLASSKVVTLTVQVKRFTPTITVTSKVSPN